MIRIAINAAAYEAIAATLPFGSVGCEAKRSADGQIWLERDLQVVVGFTPSASL
jgi:hypothetical protein